MMRRVLLIVLLGLTGLFLLALVGVGVFLAGFDPNRYSGEISAALEERTGRQALFSGDIVISFFPEPSLRTGRISLKDPGAYGGDSFATAESVSAAVSLPALLRGSLDIERIVLHSPRLYLITTASGKRNWEYGFAKPKDRPGASLFVPAAASGPLQGGGVAIPLSDPSLEKKPEPALFSLSWRHVRRISCTDPRLSYRDLRDGSAYAGRMDDFSLDLAAPGTAVPVLLTGALFAGASERAARDGKSARGLAFSLNATLGAGPKGRFSAAVASLDLETKGLGNGTRRLRSTGDILYTPDTRTLEIRDFRSRLDGESGFGTGAESAFAGTLSLVLPQGDDPATLQAELHVDRLDLDALLAGLSPPKEAPAEGEVTGAPNLSRPKVSLPDRLARESGANSGNDSGTAPAEEALQGSIAAHGDIRLTAGVLTFKRLPLTSLSVSFRSTGDRLDLPFSFALFGGNATGTAALDPRGELPSLRLKAALRDMRMADLSRVLSGTDAGGETGGAVSGVLSANLDVAGLGASWKDIAPTLAGKASADILRGEVRGFTLIPTDLRGIGKVPESFPFDRMSASATIERGIANSHDITLRARRLSAAGGGKINFPLAQMEIGIDFSLEGEPPAIPVNINGPIFSPFSSVDTRTLIHDRGE